MMRAIWLVCLLAAAACTTDEPSGAAARELEPQHAIGATTHLGVRMTPMIRTCRDACWRDIPFDECARQRDACYSDATAAGDEAPTRAARNCRQVAHACRRLRRECLQACWTNPAARPAPLVDPSRDGT